MTRQYIASSKSVTLWGLMALLALSSAPAAGASVWEWYGKPSGATSYFDDVTCWSTDSGSPIVEAVNHYLTSSRPDRTDLWDKRITFRQQSTLNGRLNVEYFFKPVVFVAEEPSYGITSSKNLLIYNNAELQVDSGTYSFDELSIPGVTGDKSGTFTLNGGRVAVNNAFIGNLCTNDAALARLIVNDGYLEVNGYLSICESRKTPGELVINGGVVTNKSQYLTVGGNAPGVATIRKGGRYCNSSTGYCLIVGSGAHGTVNIEGGEVLLGGRVRVSHVANGSANINITDGGVLSMRYLDTGSGGSANIYLDGGTIRACVDYASFLLGSSKILINVGPNGATVDTAGHAITITETFIERGRGHVAFVGGGVVTSSDPVYYSGITTIEAGTRLDLADAGTNSVKKILKNGLVVTMPEAGVASGTAILTMTGAATIDTELGSNCRVVGAPAGTSLWKLALSEDRKSIIVVEEASEPGEVLAFAEDATVSGSEPIEASAISVAQGKTVTVSAPAPNALRKTGSGTLALTSSRTAETVLADGTLRVASGASVDPANLTLGADPRVQVTFDYGGQSFNANPGALCGAHSDVTLVNGTFGVAGQGMTLANSTLRFADGAAFQGSGLTIANQTSGRAEICKASGNWTMSGTLSIGRASSVAAVFRNNGGSLSANDIFIGYYDGAASALLEVNGGNVTAARYFTVGELPNIAQTRLVVNNGGRVTNTGGSYVTVGGNSPGEMTVRKGGEYSGAGMMIVASSTSGTLNVEGGEVAIGGNFRVCDNKNKPSNPATVNITDGGVLAFASLLYGVVGSTGSPAVFNVDGGTIRAKKDAAQFIPALQYVTFNIGTRGVTFDNAGYNITIAEDMLGRGAVTFSGVGKTTLAAAQTGSGAIAVSQGSTLALTAASPTLSRRMIVSPGATLELPESGTVSLSKGMTLADGAILKYNLGPSGTSTLACGTSPAVAGGCVVAFAAGARPADRPADGVYTLTSGGGFAGKTVELAPDAPKWVRSVSVNAGGNLQMQVARLGTCVIVY